MTDADVVLIKGWHQMNAFAVAVAAGPWIGSGLGQSHHLDRRRNR